MNQEMLFRAMKKAVELGVFPKLVADEQMYLRNWAAMEEILKAALANNDYPGEAAFGVLPDQTEKKRSIKRMTTEIICCYVCSKPITGADYDNRHWWHEPDCPNYRLNLGLDDAGEWVECECDIETHEGCVPEWVEDDGTE
jgi:hypothetical protein